MQININTGADAKVSGVEAVSRDDLGARYSSFRGIDRFAEQTEGMNIGMISWPGGTLAEVQTHRYGLEYDGLYSDFYKQPGIDDMMSYARAEGAGLSVVIPTLRYVGREDAMRSDVRGFVNDLLEGRYGDMPEKMIFHIGSEHYMHFPALFGDAAAAEYGKIAAAMVNEINAVLNDPEANPKGIDFGLSVQAGRNMADDEAIRAAFSNEDLATVDLVMHHRYPWTADEVDLTLKDFSPIFEAWKADVQAAGGAAPELHLSEWNIASLTREEGLERFVQYKESLGEEIQYSDVNTYLRDHTEFETFWQNLLSERDYGDGHARLYLELFSEYQAEGMGAASLHAFDLMHNGRATYTDRWSDPVKFVGGEMIEMLYESVEGTTVLAKSTQNTENGDLWTYAYEGDTRLVLFLSAKKGVEVGEVQLNIEGLAGGDQAWDENGYAAIWAESLTARTPDDWMTRFAIKDNPNVDESPEAGAYAVGLRSAVGFDVTGDQMSLNMSQTGEVVRIIIAKTPEEALAISEWAGAPVLIQGGEVPEEWLSLTRSGDVEALFTYEADEAPVEVIEESAPEATDAPVISAAAESANSALGAILAALLAAGGAALTGGFM